MPNETAYINKGIKGINNVDKEINLPENYVTEAVNVDISNSGVVSNRDGYNKIYPGHNIHSLYKNYFVENTSLKYIDKNESVLTIHNSITPSKYLAWETVNNKELYSDGIYVYHTDGKPIGINTPGPIVLAESVGTGLLSPGVYHVAICTIDSITKEQSGASISSKIQVSNNNSILCTNFPIVDSSYEIAVFISNPNGEELYLLDTVPYNTTQVEIKDIDNLSKPLNTQFLHRITGGHILRYFKGRLFVAKNNVLWYSEAMNYGLHKPSSNFIQFSTKITIVQPVNDGLYVVADKTYFLSGTSPAQFTKTEVSYINGIIGTGLSVRSTDFSISPDQDAAYWYSDYGPVIGLSSGNIQLLTENSFVPRKEQDKGTSMYKYSNGVKQLITAFSKKGDKSSFGTKERLSGIIIRNGVVI